MDSCPSRWWCYLTISSSVVPFSSCFQSFPASGSFLMGKFFTSGGQSIGVSASASVLPMNIQDWFTLDWLDLLAVPGTLNSLLQHHSSKESILRCSVFFMAHHSHPYMTTGKTIAFTRQTFVSKIMSLLFNMLSRLVTSFLPRSKCINFMAVVTICSNFEVQGNEVSHCFHCFPSICHEVMGPDARFLVFLILHNKPTFSLSSFTFIKRLVVPLHFLPEGWYHLHIWGYWYFSRQSFFSLVLQLVLLGKTKSSTPSRSEGGLTQKTKRKEASILLGFLFYTFVSSPRSLPFVNWPSQASRLLYLKSSLWSSGLPLFHLWGLFPFPFFVF